MDFSLQAGLFRLRLLYSSHMSTQKSQVFPAPSPAEQKPGACPPAKPRRLFWKIASSVTALYLLLNIGGKCRVVTREYEVFDARVHDEVRICVVSDLHGALYGADQKELVSAIESARPDVVLLLGDLFDQHGKNKHTVTLLNALSGRFTCYFVPGNHEYKTGTIAEIRAAVKEAGIPILAGENALVVKGETRVRIFGIDDGLGGKQKQLRQIVQSAKQMDPAEYSVLAVHVPNGVESYLRYGFDLMLSGHTHGGQVILPGLLNGLYAPGQGFFPKYGGGRYDLENTTLIISRGLARKPLWLPRVFNPPEVTVLSLKPDAANP